MSEFTPLNEIQTQAQLVVIWNYWAMKKKTETAAEIEEYLSKLSELEKVLIKKERKARQMEQAEWRRIEKQRVDERERKEYEEVIRIRSEWDEYKEKQEAAKQEILEVNVQLKKIKTQVAEYDIQNGISKKIQKLQQQLKDYSDSIGGDALTQKKTEMEKLIKTPFISRECKHYKRVCGSECYSCGYRFTASDCAFG
jgi:DNA repair exonuclease SbcCD ATPase subunit